MEHTSINSLRLPKSTHRRSLLIGYCRWGTSRPTYRSTMPHEMHLLLILRPKKDNPCKPGKNSSGLVILPIRSLEVLRRRSPLKSTMAGRSTSSSQKCTTAQLTPYSLLKDLHPRCSFAMQHKHPQDYTSVEGRDRVRFVDFGWCGEEGEGVPGIH